jgi:hypothetical protein
VWGTSINVNNTMNAFNKFFEKFARDGSGKAALPASD